MMKIKNNNSGLALITAMITVFIVTALLTTMTVDNYLLIKKLSNQKNLTDSTALMLGGIDLAKAGLVLSSINTNIDTLNDLWATPISQGIPVVDGINVSGYMIDENRKFNLNSLIDTSGEPQMNQLNKLINLFNLLNITPTLAFDIMGYIAKKSNSLIALQYQKLDPPRSIPGRPFTDLSELLLIHDMKPEWLPILNKYVTVYPSFNGIADININTASAEVISACSNLPLDIAERIVSYRKNDPFLSVGAISQFLQQNGIMVSSGGNQQTNPLNIDIGELNVQSYFFTVHLTADNGDYQNKLVALLFRPYRGGITWPSVVWQHSEM